MLNLFHLSKSMVLEVLLCLVIFFNLLSCILLINKTGLLWNLKMIFVIHFILNRCIWAYFWITIERTLQACLGKAIRIMVRLAMMLIETGSPLAIRRLSIHVRHTFKSLQASTWYYPENVLLLLFFIHSLVSYVVLINSRFRFLDLFYLFSVNIVIFLLNSWRDGFIWSKFRDAYFLFFSNHTEKVVSNIIQISSNWWLWLDLLLLFKIFILVIEIL